ncbi:dihydropteroate synthase [Niveibacterium terrae]|uniref:dihydropteroate synthase n=1 Tax=Niveibacterium terrae TaxID=3373598 RepID=UPI003A8D1537
MPAFSLMQTRYFDCGPYRLRLDRPLVMAIINTTPDSFSGDGVAGSVALAVERAKAAIDAGADILDVGGESTRPGSAAVALDEELRRVIPVVEALAPLGLPISIDTVKPEVMVASLAAGASLVNDINALRAPGALEAVVASNCGVCVMHMQGEPRTMQDAPAYGDVVADVEAFLVERRDTLIGAGVSPTRILLDPGFGFGKSLAHNIELFGALERLAKSGPLLVGVCRKRMIGEITGCSLGERDLPSVVAAIAAVARGAAVLRVHDAAALRAGLKIWEALAPGALKFE